MQELCEHFLRSNAFKSSSLLLHIWQAESATEHLATAQLRHPDPQPVFPIKYQPLLYGPLCKLGPRKSDSAQEENVKEQRKCY